MPAQATEKQIRFALYLLEKAGYSTNWMDASFRSLGAGMRERSGKVTDWLAGMSTAQISGLIQTLQSKIRRNQKPDTECNEE